MKARYLIGIPLSIAAGAVYMYRKRKAAAELEADRSAAVRDRAAALIAPKPRRIDHARGRVASLVRATE